MPALSDGSDEEPVGENAMVMKNDYMVGNPQPEFLDNSSPEQPMENSNTPSIDSQTTK